jgi:hypothetical protein
MPRPPNPMGKRPRYPFNRRQSGPQSRSGRRGEQKILDPTGARTLTPLPSSPYPVAIPTALSRYLLPGGLLRKTTKENLGYSVSGPRSVLFETHLFVWTLLFCCYATGYLGVSKQFPRSHKGISTLPFQNLAIINEILLELFINILLYIMPLYGKH